MEARGFLRRMSLFAGMGADAGDVDEKVQDSSSMLAEGVGEGCFRLCNRSCACYPVLS